MSDCSGGDCLVYGLIMVHVVWGTGSWERDISGSKNGFVVKLSIE